MANLDDLIETKTQKAVANNVHSLREDINSNDNSLEQLVEQLVTIKSKVDPPSEHAVMICNLPVSGGLFTF